jgi:methyl-accepting chemotaxis protein
VSESNANTQALIDTINAIIRAETVDEVVRATLDTVRKEFGLVYGSYWVVDPAENALVFALESGRVDDEFQRLTRTARFREGEGLNGRSWRLRDLVHITDLGELHDCCRAPLARRAGIKTAIALPVLRDGQVAGTLDFFSYDAVEISPVRLSALRMIGRMSSDKFSKLARQGELLRIKQMIENAPVNVMYADRDLKLVYMNATAIKTFKRMEQYLPVKVEQMVGQSLDIFHKNPEHQRRLLADPATVKLMPSTATDPFSTRYRPISGGTRKRYRQALPSGVTSRISPVPST